MEILQDVGYITGIKGITAVTVSIMTIQVSIMTIIVILVTIEVIEIIIPTMLVVILIISQCKTCLLHLLQDILVKY